MDDRDCLCSEGSSDSEESPIFEVVASLDSLSNTYTQLISFGCMISELLSLRKRVEQERHRARAASKAAS